jgi:hypothetical protein
MFQVVPPPIIRSSKTINTATGICYQIPDAVCVISELLMMGGGTALNM